MKTVLSIVFAFLLLSCEKESFEQPAHHGLLKRKLHYLSPKDSIPVNVFDYEYDSKNRLVRIQQYSYYELFKYTVQDQKIARYGYKTDGSGSTLTDSTSYTYQNGNLVLEELFYLTQIYSNSSTQTEYEYEHSKLKSKKEYHDHQFYRMTNYEYSGDFCTRENHYYGSMGSEIVTYKIYVYDKDLLSMINYIFRQAGGALAEVIYFLYDEKGNLILENAQHIGGMYPFAYSYRYEYY